MLSRAQHRGGFCGIELGTRARRSNSTAQGKATSASSWADATTDCREARAARSLAASSSAAAGPPAMPSFGSPPCASPFETRSPNVKTASPTGHRSTQGARPVASGPMCRSHAGGTLGVALELLSTPHPLSRCPPPSPPRPPASCDVQCDVWWCACQGNCSGTPACRSNVHRVKEAGRENRSTNDVCQGIVLGVSADPAVFSPRVGGTAIGADPVWVLQKKTRSC